MRRQTLIHWSLHWSILKVLAMDTNGLNGSLYHGTYFPLEIELCPPSGTSSRTFSLSSSQIRWVNNKRAECKQKNSSSDSFPLSCLIFSYSVKVLELEKEVLIKYSSNLLSLGSGKVLFIYSTEQIFPWLHHIVSKPELWSVWPRALLLERE